MWNTKAQRIISGTAILAVVLISFFTWPSSSLRAQSAHTVTISFDPPLALSGVSSYNLKRGTTQSGPYPFVQSVPLGSGTARVSFIDSAGIQDGAKYFYVVTSVCPSCTVSQESSPSAEVSAQIPFPAGPPAAPRNPTAIAN